MMMVMMMMISLFGRVKLNSDEITVYMYEIQRGITGR